MTKRDELASARAFAQELLDENRNLKARLLAFEEGRSASDFPLDSEGWQYDGERLVTAPHIMPAFPGERMVVCELHGLPETRERNAFLICHARSAIFWCEAHERAAEGFSGQLAQRDEKIGHQFLVIAELVRRLTILPPDLLTVLESLLEQVGFHFQPDAKTIRLVREIERIIAQIKAVTT